jgi:hypothetical protein
MQEKTMRKLLLSIPIVLGAMLVAGCDEEELIRTGNYPDYFGRIRTVQLQFMNHTDNDHDVWIKGRGRQMRLGEAEAGELFRYDLNLPIRALPVEIDWKAGPYQDRFVLREDSDRTLRFALGRPRHRWGRDDDWDRDDGWDDRDDDWDRDGGWDDRDDEQDRRRFRLIFANRTPWERGLDLDLAGRRDPSVVRIASGSRRSYTLVVRERDLPYRVRWDAGADSGELLLTRRSPETVVIPITRVRGGDDRDDRWNRRNPRRQTLRIQFINRTEERVRLRVGLMERDADRETGWVDARDRRTVEYTVDQEDLPATLRWWADRKTGTLSVHRDPQRLYRVLITEEGARDDREATVRVEFINRTNERLRLRVGLMGAGGDREFGSIDEGETETISFEVDRRNLPGTVRWWADRMTGTFRVGREVDERYRVILTPEGGRDEGDVRIRVRFINRTDHRRRLVIGLLDGDGSRKSGAVAANDTETIEYVIDRRKLPGRIRWWADRETGTFGVARTPEDVYEIELD